MNNVRILYPTENLIENITSELTSRDKDYSRQIVVFPGKRPAHFLRKSLAERENGSFFPPRIFSIDEFIDFVYTNLLGCRQQILEPIDAVAILFDVHKSLKSRLGHTSYNTFDVFLPVGLKLFKELEEVMMANHTMNYIRKILQNVEFAKFHSLSNYYEKFYEEVTNRGFGTRSMRYRTVAERFEELDFSQYEKIIFAGFYAFTNVEQIIVKKLLKQKNVIIIFQDGVGLSERLKSIGVQFDERKINTTTVSDKKIYFYRAPDTHGQIYCLTAELNRKIKLGDKIDHRTAIVLPTSESLFPTIHFPLSLFNEDEYNIALGYSVKRTPAYGFLVNLLDLIIGSINNKFYASDYINFVLHPYVKNIRFRNRSDVTRIIFHQIEKYLANEKPKNLLSIESIENDDELFNYCLQAVADTAGEIDNEQLKLHIKAIHDNTIRRFLEIKSIGDFSNKAIEVLNYIFTNSTANLHPYFRPYVQKLMESLSKTAHSLIKDYKFSDPANYKIYLQHLLEGETVPFQGTPLRGLQVLGLLETRNLSFDTIYFIDANDDVVPGKPGDDMLLPHHIRKLLGLETYHDREKLIEYYFDLAINNAKEIHLFYTESSKDGKKEKSRFVQKLLWKKQQELKTFDANTFENIIHYNVNLENKKPAKVDKTLEMVNQLRANKFSSSQLDTYLACELRFYYQNVLGMKEKTELSDELEAKDVGTLVHDILEEYFKPLVGKKLSEKDLSRNRLEEIVNKMMENIYGKKSDGDWLGHIVLMHNQIVNHLWDFIENYQIPKAREEEILIKSLEKNIDVEVNEYKFIGVIDRIETRGNKIFILDYKTTSDDKYLKIKLDKLNIEDKTTYRESIGSFQLPMYMLLYGASTKTPFNNIIPGYLFLGRNKIDKDIETLLGDDSANAETVFNLIQPVIFNIVNEICDINKPFTPTEFLEEECSLCPYKTICGTMWVKGWGEE